MDETHVCVLDREGVVIHESKTASTAQSIADELAKAPSCRRIVFETGRMAPILFHGLGQLGLPVVCVESRQAYQALKSLATHKTDRNDARGLAHLARTGFFKPVHVKSLSAHAVRSLIIARKKLVGQRVTLENQIRGFAVVFGVRLPAFSQPPSSIRLSKPARGSPVSPPPCAESLSPIGKWLCPNRRAAYRSRQDQSLRANPSAGNERTICILYFGCRQSDFRISTITP